MTQVVAQPGRSVPLRTCVGCRRVVAQTELQRFVLVDGVVTPDPGRTAAGRGAWLHPDPNCVGLACRRGGFARAFRTRVSDAELCQPPGTS